MKRGAAGGLTGGTALNLFPVKVRAFRQSTLVILRPATPRPWQERWDFGSICLNAEDNEYTADPSGDCAAPGGASAQAFTFDNPDLNVRSLRGNAVLRWEYRPGSTIFFVWQQQRAGSRAFGDFDFGRDANAVFQQRPDNIFVIKASYWIGR